MDVELDVPAGDYRIEVFANPTEGADPSGYGEGESLAAAQIVTHTGSGPESFVVAVPAVFAGDAVERHRHRGSGGRLLWGQLRVLGCGHRGGVR